MSAGNGASPPPRNGVESRPNVPQKQTKQQQIQEVQELQARLEAEQARCKAAAADSIESKKQVTRAIMETGKFRIGGAKKK